MKIKDLPIASAKIHWQLLLFLGLVCLPILGLWSFLQRPTPPKTASANLQIVIPREALEGDEFRLYLNQQFRAHRLKRDNVIVESVEGGAHVVLLCVPNEIMKLEWQAARNAGLLLRLGVMPNTHEFKGQPFCKVSKTIRVQPGEDLRIELPSPPLAGRIRQDFVLTEFGSGIPQVGDLERLQWVAKVQLRLEAAFKEFSSDPVLAELHRLDRSSSVTIILPPELGGGGPADSQWLRLMGIWLHMRYFGWFPGWQAIETYRVGRPVGAPSSDEFFRNQFGRDRSGDAMMDMLKKLNNYLNSIDLLVERLVEKAGGD